MRKKLSRKRLILFLALGILGSICLAASDWLMIYGNPAYEGQLAWLTEGVAHIPPQRNALALMLSIPAVFLYCIALFAAANFLKQHPLRRTYSFLVALGMTPWMALHLFYVVILFAFGWLQNHGFAEAAFPLCEAIFQQFAWLVPVSEVLMVLPFLYQSYVIFIDKSCFSRWMTLNNPILLYVVLKVLTLLLPNTAFRLAFTNGLMSEAMALWFLFFLVFLPNPEQAVPQPEKGHHHGGTVKQNSETQ